MASQEVIKDLGNNGGGWFNTNCPMRTAFAIPMRPRPGS